MIRIGYNFLSFRWVSWPLWSRVIQIDWADRVWLLDNLADVGTILWCFPVGIWILIWHLGLNHAVWFRLPMNNFIWTDYTALCDIAQFWRRGAFFLKDLVGSGTWQLIWAGLLFLQYKAGWRLLTQLAVGFWILVRLLSTYSRVLSLRTGQQGLAGNGSVKWKMPALYHVVQ